MLTTPMQEDSMLHQKGRMTSMNKRFHGGNRESITFLDQALDNVIHLDWTSLILDQQMMVNMTHTTPG
eukprot:Ihof_evm9s331 gene=Ihof_evmTU9s331